MYKFARYLLVLGCGLYLPVASGQISARLNIGHTSRISDWKVTQQGSLFSAGEDGRVIRWDLNSRRMVGLVGRIEGPVTGFAVSENEREVYVSSQNSSISTLITDRDWQTVIPNSAGDKVLQILPNGQLVAQAGADSIYTTGNGRARPLVAMAADRHIVTGGVASNDGNSIFTIVTDTLGKYKVSAYSRASGENATIRWSRVSKTGVIKRIQYLNTKNILAMLSGTEGAPQIDLHRGSDGQHLGVIDSTHLSCKSTHTDIATTADEAGLIFVCIGRSATLLSLPSGKFIASIADSGIIGGAAMSESAELIPIFSDGRVLRTLARQASSASTENPITHMALSGSTVFDCSNGNARRLVDLANERYDSESIGCPNKGSPGVSVRWVLPIKGTEGSNSYLEVNIRGRKVKLFGHQNQRSTQFIGAIVGADLYSLGDDRTLRRWNLDRGYEIWQADADLEDTLGVLSMGSNVTVTGARGAFSSFDQSSGRRLVSGVVRGDQSISFLDEGFMSCNGCGDIADEINLQLSADPRVSLPLIAFFDVFHRPDVVAARLRGDEAYVSGAVRALTIESVIRRSPPRVKAVAVPRSEPNSYRVIISFVLKAEAGGIGEVLVFHNGKLIKSDGYYRDAPGSTLVAMNATKATSASSVAAGIRKMLDDGEAVPSAGAGTSRVRNSVVIRQAKPKVLNAAGEYSDSVEIDVIPGEDNEITVMARNADNTILGQGQTVRFKSTLPKAEPHLWILPVGIGSFADRSVPTLASPKKDALDFACSYGGKEAVRAYGVPCNQPGYAAGLFKPGNIHVVEPLTNERATRANILAKLDEVAAKARPGDTFVWFVSSHGTMDGNSVYGIVPFDAKCKGTDCDGLVSSNDILDKSKAIKAMKQLLVLDTCQAGGLDNKMSGLYDARMAGLAKNMGLHLYAAATATESALDGQDASKNSVFTATLLEGLAGKAPKNSDGTISIIPLGQYVKAQTPEAARKAWGNDTVQTPLVQHFGKDAPLAAGSNLR